MRFAPVVILVAFTTTAQAEPRGSLGIGLARVAGHEYPVGWDGHAVHGALRVSRAARVQLELARFETESGYGGKRVGVSGAVDLTTGSIAPFVLLAIAGERAANGLGGVDDFCAVEIGVGLRIPISAELSVGVDLRAGERDHVDSRGESEIALWAPGLVGGGYRAGRISLDVAF